MIYILAIFLGFLSSVSYLIYSTGWINNFLYSLNSTKISDKKDQFFLRIPFFRVPSLRVPIIRDDEVIAYLHIQLDMEASSMEAYNTAKIFLPRLIDAIYCDLYEALSKRYCFNLDVKTDTLKKRGKLVAEKVIGSGTVKNVFIKEFYLEKK